MKHILYQNICKKKSKNRITLDLKKGEIGRTKNKITKDENDENAMQLETVEVLAHCIIANNIYQQD